MSTSNNFVDDDFDNIMTGAGFLDGSLVAGLLAQDIRRIHNQITQAAMITFHFYLLLSY